MIGEPSRARPGDQEPHGQGFHGQGPAGQGPAGQGPAGQGTAGLGPADGERRDRGLDGVVPFTFACHRCGHCCSHGEGHVWLEPARPGAPGQPAVPAEVDRLAARLGLTPEAFRARFVRTVPSPGSGVLAESLREGPDGRCPLLAGANTCTAYEDRPEHCRTFPYWPSVLGDADGFRRAAAICPGIRVEPTPEARAEAFRRLAAVYAEVDELLAAVRPVCLGRGVCCRFEDAGHELFATGLEADYAAHLHPAAPPPEAPGRCPYHVAGRCTARAGRPLGCRTYFCDRPFEEALQATHERLLADVRRIEAETGYPRSYARFPALLAARGVGGTAHASPPRPSGPPGPSP